jgi:hypothetical protein
MNGEIVIPEEPEMGNCFVFQKMTVSDGLDESDLFTLTWFYRAFAIYTPIPRDNHRFFSQRTVDIADRFMSLWICFNSILKKHYGERLSDRALIGEATTDLTTNRATIPWMKYYQTMYDPEYRRNLDSLTDRLPVQNMKNGALVDFSNGSLFEIMYEIRCNLFHGRKDPTDTEGRDFQLLRLAFFLLAPLIIEYAREHDLIETWVRRDFEIAWLENGIYFNA